MNRKNNPWVTLIAALLLAVILVLTCTACGNSAEAVGTTETKNSTHFEVDWQSYHPLLGTIFTITDAETGVQYLAVHDGQGIGLTKLEPAPESEEVES